MFRKAQYPGLPAAVFSSKIEGEDMELDSYIKHKKFGVKFLPDYTKKISSPFLTEGEHKTWQSDAWQYLNKKGELEKTSDATRN